MCSGQSFISLGQIVSCVIVSLRFFFLIESYKDTWDLIFFPRSHCSFFQRFYLIGSDRNKKFFRVLKIDRMEPSDLNISEDPVVYPPQEVKSLLQRIAEGNRATGGLNFVAKVYGIVGKSGKWSISMSSNATTCAYLC